MTDFFDWICWWWLASRWWEVTKVFLLFLEFVCPICERYMVLVFSSDACGDLPRLPVRCLFCHRNGESWTILRQIFINKSCLSNIYHICVPELDQCYIYRLLVHVLSTMFQLNESQKALNLTKERNKVILRLYWKTLQLWKLLYNYIYKYHNIYLASANDFLWRLQLSL